MKFRLFLSFLVIFSVISCGKKETSPVISKPPISAYSGTISSEVHASGSRQDIVVPPFDPNTARTIKYKAHSGVVIIQRTNGPISR